MRGSLAISAGMHAAFGALLIIGLPSLTPERLEIGAPIPVELVDARLLEAPEAPVEPVSEPPEPAALPDEAPEPPPAARPVSPPPPPSPPPSSPSRRETAPMPPLPEARPTPPEPVPAPEVKPEIEPEIAARPPAAALAPTPAAKPSPPQPAAAAEQAPEPDQDRPDETPFDARALVVDLTPREPGPRQQSAAAASRASAAEIAQMQAAIKTAIERHWSINAGAAAARDIVVDVRIALNPDRTLRSVTVVDQARYGSDAAFRAAADRALRAVRLASPLPVQPDMFDYWKEITFRFDPSNLL